ncbi:hypothetical protein AGMMS50268_01510 [Spirochaetia bacterium]|nr:hypothetical protein AGMMS50268_01510 [Spirochaetia bacterium]
MDFSAYTEQYLKETNEITGTINKKDIIRATELLSALKQTGGGQIIYYWRRRKRSQCFPCGK